MDAAYLTIAVPDNPASVAAARACILPLEPYHPDPETYDVPKTRLKDAAGNFWRGYGSSVEPWVAQSAKLWRENPEQFLAIIVGYSAERYPELPAPTLEQVTLFLSEVRISTVEGTLAGFTEMELALVEEAEDAPV